MSRNPGSGWPKNGVFGGFGDVLERFGGYRGV